MTNTTVFLKERKKHKHWCLKHSNSKLNENDNTDIQYNFFKRKRKKTLMKIQQGKYTDVHKKLILNVKEYTLM